MKYEVLAAETNPNPIESRGWIGVENAAVVGFPIAHFLDHGEVVRDRGFHGRGRDDIKDMRSPLGTSLKVPQKIVPIALVERVADLQEHSVLLGKRKHTTLFCLALHHGGKPLLLPLLHSTRDNESRESRIGRLTRWAS